MAALSPEIFRVAGHGAWSKASSPLDQEQNERQSISLFYANVIFEQKTVKYFKMDSWLSCFKCIRLNTTYCLENNTTFFINNINLAKLRWISHIQLVDCNDQTKFNADETKKNHFFRNIMYCRRKQHLLNFSSSAHL